MRYTVWTILATARDTRSAVPIHATVTSARRGTRCPHGKKSAKDTGAAMMHMPATTTSNHHFQGTANATREPSASNSGYHPAAQMMWKTAKISDQEAAEYAIHACPRASSVREVTAPKCLEHNS